MNEMNELFDAFAKVASKKMENLRSEFEMAADKIIQELADAMNKVEEKHDKEEPRVCEEMAGCDGCGKCEYDEDEEIETVTLNEEAYVQDKEPSQLVTIYAKNLREDPVIAVEYDKDMGPTGAMAAVVGALMYVMHHSMTEEGIDVDFESVEDAVLDGIVNMVTAAACSAMKKNIEKELKNNA